MTGAAFQVLMSKGGSATGISTTGNFGQANNSAITFASGAGSQFHGWRWTAGASGGILSVKINIGSFTSGGNVTASLYSDSASHPGSQIGSSSGVVVPSATGDLTFTFSAPPSVTASTVYWIVLDASAGGTSCTITTATTISGYDSGRASTIAAVSPDNYASSVTIKMQIN